MWKVTETTSVTMTPMFYFMLLFALKAATTSPLIQVICGKEQTALTYQCCAAINGDTQACS